MNNDATHNPLVSLILVTYNSADLLPDFLAALALTTYTAYELIAVDNASTDGTIEMLRREQALKLVIQRENLGFGRACNHGAAVANGEYLLFLNPDVRVTPNWLTGLLASARACPDALICPTTLYPAEQPQPTPGLQQVAAIPGAAMLVPRPIWQALGGFDQHFFLYWEDTELCWRAWLLGYRVLADRDTFVYHQRGGSTSGGRWDAERTKNSLRTYLKLMPWPSTLRFAALLALKTVVKVLLRRDAQLLAAWGWNWRNLGLTLAERRSLRQRRRGNPRVLAQRIVELERRLRSRRQAEYNCPALQFCGVRRERIVYITDSEGMGGAETYLLTLLEHVDHQQYRVGLILPQRNATAPLVERAQTLGVDITYFDSVHRDGLSVVAVARSYQLLRTMRPTIVHAVLNGPRRSAETLLAAWLLGVPKRIATFQLVTAIPQQHGLGRLVRTLNRRLQFRMLTAGIAVSHGNARLLVEQYGFSAKHLAIIPNGVDLAAFRGEDSGAVMRAAWGVPDAVPLLGVVGRLATQKGQRVLLDALPQVWQQFPLAQLVFIGAGEREAELRAQAAQIDQFDRIHFVGSLPKAAIPSALAALDLFVLPSLYEGLPFAVVEAMAAGKPIVATNVDGTTEAIRHAVSGLLVAPGDHAPLAEALLQLLGDPALCERLGTAAREAASRFDQTAMLAATFGLYRVR